MDYSWTQEENVPQLKCIFHSKVFLTALLFIKWFTYLQLTYLTLSLHRTCNEQYRILTILYL